MADATQTGRLISVEISSLPKDLLLLTGFFGNEEMSSLFSLNLELVSQHPEQVIMDDIIGKNATISVKLQDGSERFFNGFINRLSLGGRELGGDERFTHYEAQVVPWLWFLTRNAKCFIHQDKTIPEIIKDTFENLGLRDFRDELNLSYAKWDYCVQYRDTDFQLFWRLPPGTQSHARDNHKQRSCLKAALEKGRTLSATGMCSRSCDPAGTLYVTITSRCRRSRSNSPKKRS